MSQNVVRFNLGILRKPETKVHGHVTPMLGDGWRELWVGGGESGTKS